MKCRFSLLLGGCLLAFPLAAQPTSGQLPERRAEQPGQRQEDGRNRAPSRPDRQGSAREPVHRDQLTPDERRQLRRDIREQGRDVYRDGRPQR